MDKLKGFGKELPISIELKYLPSRIKKDRINECRDRTRLNILIKKAKDGSKNIGEHMF